MDPLHDKLKALKPDEPDDEIEKDLASIRQQQPGITDDQIYTKAQALVQGGGKTLPPAAGAPPAPPASLGGPSGVVPPPPPPAAPPAAPAPGAPPAGAPMDPSLDDIAHPSGGRTASMAALEGLAGLGDAISGSYGHNKTDFLKTAMGSESNELAKREAVSKAVMDKAKGASELKTAGIEQGAAQKSAADLAALQDPTSDLSKARQDAYKPILLSAGFTEDQVAKIPGQVIEQTMQGATSLADAKAKLAELKMTKEFMEQTEGHKVENDKAARIAEIDAQLAKMGVSGRLFNSAEAKSLQAERAKLSADPGGAPPAPGRASAPPANLPTISTQDAYDALPSGAEYLAPDGSHKRKK